MAYHGSLLLILLPSFPDLGIVLGGKYILLLLDKIDNIYGRSGTLRQQRTRARAGLERGK